MGVSVAVFVTVWVRVAVAVLVAVGVFVAVVVFVAVAVAVGVCVTVGVAVAVFVAVAVGVAVSVRVAVGVGVPVGRGVRDGRGVREGVSLGVAVEIPWRGVCWITGGSPVDSSVGRCNPVDSDSGVSSVSGSCALTVGVSRNNTARAIINKIRRFTNANYTTRCHERRCYNHHNGIGDTFAATQEFLKACLFRVCILPL